MTDDGYTVIKSGYPDLFCVKDGKIVLIECKHGERERLKTNQALMLELFAGCDIPCYRYDKGGKMTRIPPKERTKLLV